MSLKAILKRQNHIQAKWKLTRIKSFAKLWNQTALFYVMKIIGSVVLFFSVFSLLLLSWKFFVLLLSTLFALFAMRFPFRFGLICATDRARGQKFSFSFMNESCIEVFVCESCVFNFIFFVAKYYENTIANEEWSEKLRKNNRISSQTVKIKSEERKKIATNFVENGRKGLYNGHNRTQVKNGIFQRVLPGRSSDNGSTAMKIHPERMAQIQKMNKNNKFKFKVLEAIILSLWIASMRTRWFVMDETFWFTTNTFRACICCHLIFRSIVVVFCVVLLLRYWYWFSSVSLSHTDRQNIEGFGKLLVPSDVMIPASVVCIFDLFPVHLISDFLRFFCYFGLCCILFRFKYDIKMN